MSVPTVMRWDHKNAPQITNLSDWEQTKNWYKTIFVDGYLDDDDVTLIPPLGWDYVADDGTKYITLTMIGDSFTQNLSRLVLKYAYFLENTSYGYHGHFTEHYDSRQIVRFGNSTDSTTVSNGTPTMTGINVRGQTDYICPYVVIGNNRGVYFLSGYNGSLSTSNRFPEFSSSNGYSAWSYFGDFVNDGVDYGRNNQCSTDIYYNSDDSVASYNYNNLTSLGNWKNTVGKCRVYTQDAVNHYNGIQVARDHLGEPRGLNFSATPYMYWAGNYHLGAHSNFALKYPYVDGSLKIVPHELWIRNNLATVVNGDRQIIYIGKMPGMYYPLHFRPFSYSGYMKNLIEFEGTGEYEDEHFIGLARYGSDEFYINVTEDWGI